MSTSHANSPAEIPPHNQSTTSDESSLQRKRLTVGGLLIAACTAGALTLASTAFAAPPTFYSRLYPLLSYYKVVKTADFNGDGFGDVAISQFFSPIVIVKLGFGATTTYILPASVSDLDVGDFNGDGKMDIAAVDNINLKIMTNNGTGTNFTVTSHNLNVGASGPLEIAAADFNNDGKTDLATANQSDNLSIFRQGAPSGSNPTFSVFHGGTLGTGLDVPQGIAVGNFGGDFKPDLAVVHEYDNTAKIMINTGSGVTFTPSSITISQPYGQPVPVDIKAADFNNDGKTDLATTNSGTAGSSYVAVILRNGSGTFDSPVTVYTLSGSLDNAITAADLNSDGKVDIAGSAAGSASAFVLTNNGSGISYTQTSEGLDDFGGSTVTAASDITFGDGDNNGIKDLFVANGSGFSVLWGGGGLPVFW